jgi:hypothetical protein
MYYLCKAMDFAAPKLTERHELWKQYSAGG